MEGVVSNPTATRGYRNKNPGNIDHSEANKWQGLASPPLEPPPGGGGRPRFAVFVSHEYGIRALAVLLTTYQDRHGLRTIQGIVSRWAPGSENNTAAYVRHVCELTGRRATDILDLHSHADLRPLVEAIITHELGGNPYSASTIDQGLLLAGVPNPVHTIAQAAATPAGRATLQATGVTGAAGVLVAASPALAGLQGLDWRVGVAIVVAVGLAAAFFVLLRKKAARDEAPR
jgi:hypothetical protein